MSRIYHDVGAPVGYRANEHKPMIATTVYEDPDAGYTFAIAKTLRALDRQNIPHDYLLLSGNCHVDDARNKVVQEFLISNCTDLIFIDADVNWQPQHIIELLNYENVEIVGGVYPYRQSENESMPFRPKDDGLVRTDGLVEVDGLPTGFMRISRHVLHLMARNAEQFWHREDRRMKVPIVFERTYKDGVRWGGDLNFCNKWREDYDGKIYAAPNMTLSHAGKYIAKDSLAAFARRQKQTTLKHICEKIRNGDPATFEDLAEARKYTGNPGYVAKEDSLMSAITLARKADGPIIETGSGLSTILMAAAAPDQIVYCLEHHGLWAANLRQLSAESGITNIALVECEINAKTGFYKLTDDDLDELPIDFALAFHDGPPRAHKGRMAFFDIFAETCGTIIVDDCDDPNYREAIERWCVRTDRKSTFIEPRTLIIE